MSCLLSLPSDLEINFHTNINSHAKTKVLSKILLALGIVDAKIITAHFSENICSQQLEIRLMPALNFLIHVGKKGRNRGARMA